MIADNSVNDYHSDGNCSNTHFRDALAVSSQHRVVVVVTRALWRMTRRESTVVSNSRAKNRAFFDACCAFVLFDFTPEHRAA